MPVSDPASASTNRNEQAVFFKEWKMEELLAAVANLSDGRDFKQGREVFNKAMCGACHALGGYSQGNGASPDLTGLGTKYTRDIILESILKPSAVISSQYYTTIFRLKNGDVVQGTVMDEIDGKRVIATSPLNLDDTVSVTQADIQSEEPSTVSSMPEGLIDVFTQEQILDLFAFLDAQGNPDAAIFKKPNAKK